MQLEACITSAALHGRTLCYIASGQVYAALLPAPAGAEQKQHIVLGGGWTEIKPVALGCAALTLTIAAILACRRIRPQQAADADVEGSRAKLAARPILLHPDGLLTQGPIPTAADLQESSPARSSPQDIKVKPFRELICR